MLDEYLKGTDNVKDKNLVHIVLVDYAKPFDHIDTIILLKGLTYLDMPNRLLRWIELFIIDQQQ